MTTAVIAATRFGPMIVPPYDLFLARAMISRGEYAPEEFETWLPYLPEGGVVLDIGANFGAHTFAFADVVGPLGMVLAFEPQRMLYNMLCGTIALVGATHVHAKHTACGRESGTAFVPRVDYTGPGNFGAVEVKGTVQGEPVPIVSIDSFAIARADFLKIDVEGMEIDVLCGARDTIDRCRPVLSVEADRQPTVPALLEFLASANYRVWWHRPPLGDLWPNMVSINLLALPRDRSLPEPIGDLNPI